MIGFEAGARTVVLLLGLAVVAEALMSTCFAMFQAFERLVYIPIVLITQRWVTSGVGIAALALGAGVETVSAIYLAGAVGALVLALFCLFTRVARPRLDGQPKRWWPLMRVALPVGIAGVFATILFRVDSPRCWGGSRTTRSSVTTARRIGYWRAHCSSRGASARRSIPSSTAVAHERDADRCRVRGVAPSWGLR